MTNSSVSTCSISIIPVLLLTDNYAYIVHRRGSAQCIVIDPSESTPIERVVREQNLRIALILNTHHHHDHVGGNLALKEFFGARVHCSNFDLQRVPGATSGLQANDQILFDGIEVESFLIPGHTQGQVAYYIREAASLFVGDTLFAMGCGRLLEGTPEQMRDSLARIATLPRDTRVYFGHEYTKKNGSFALSVEPNNPEIALRMKAAAEALASHGIVPAPTLEDELKVNPFLRLQSPDIRRNIGLMAAQDLEVFRHLRSLRDHF